MSKKILYIILLLLVSMDIGYSFLQHYNMPLDGDMAESILPANGIKKVLKNPLGFKVFREQTTYQNPNRFFSHWFFNQSFNKTPQLLRSFKNPIDSVYLTCAIVKIVVQIILLILLAIAISGTTKVFDFNFILAVALITPLFQANGFFAYMGIIDQSITYVFFYALPLALLMLYFLPLLQKHYYNKKLRWEKIIWILWIPLTLIVCLSGPLNPGVILVTTALVLLYQFLVNFAISKEVGFIKGSLEAIRRIPKDYFLYLIPICVFSLYSLYIGTYNSFTIKTQIPLIELYSRIPEGLYHQFTSKLGFPVLFLILIFNAIFISRNHNTNEGQKILKLYKWVGLFAIFYILLLPLGGYREYRSNVLRYDTIMPITLSLVFLFGHSTLFLIKHISFNQKKWYLPIIVIIAFIFTNSDESKFDKNDCERLALQQISEAKEKVVKLDHECSVFSWEITKTPEKSKLNSRVIKHLKITNEEKLFYFDK